MASKLDLYHVMVWRTNLYNCDKKSDLNGRDLIKMCNDLNFGIVNGRFGQDKMVGQFTCVKTIGQSTVDYAIISSSLFPYVSDFWIDAFDSCMSDVHLPICLELNIKKQAEKTQEAAIQKYSSIKFKSTWQAEKKSDYQSAFSPNRIMQFSEKMLNQRAWDTTQEDMDQFSNELAAIIVEPAKQVGLCKRIKNGKNKPRLNPRKPWFNETCEKNRRFYFKSKNAIWSAKSPTEKK